MNEIRAIIRPTRLEKLRTALRDLPNFPGLTVFKVEGFTAPSSLDKRSDEEELTDFSPKLMVCILADKGMTEQIQKVISDQCSTGQMGDGLSWVVEATAVTRIRDSAVLPRSKQ